MHILQGDETATRCSHLIDCCLSKEKKSGEDLRRVVIQIYLLLKDLDCSSKVLLLLQTIIKVGEVSYSLDVSRSPRQLLQCVLVAHGIVSGPTWPTTEDIAVKDVRPLPARPHCTQPHPL